jgi:hypothetical protein
MANTAADREEPRQETFLEKQLYKTTIMTNTRLFLFLFLDH